MKLILIATAVLVLAGCDGPSAFDTRPNAFVKEHSGYGSQDIAGCEFDWCVSPASVALKAKADAAGCTYIYCSSEASLKLKAKEIAAAKIADAKWEKQLAKAKKEKLAAAKKEGVKIGMDKTEVLQSSWGKPRSINRTTNVHGVREQWVYDGSYLYFDGETLTSIQN